MTDIGIMGLGIYTPPNAGWMPRKSPSDQRHSRGCDPEEIRRRPQSRYPRSRGHHQRHGHRRRPKDAIAMAGIDPKEIDIVIWNGAQHKDYLNWLAGLHVAREIGADNAWSFDMEAMCGSMMAGMEVARSLMIANENYRTVLLVSGYRNGDMVNYDVKETSFMYDIGAGGAAMILRQGLCGRNRIVGTAFRGDGSFSTDCVVKAGGSAALAPAARRYSQHALRNRRRGQL
jgi:3-oxoacyl-[acyl-carrier-protein] synthase-3